MNRTVHDSISLIEYAQSLYLTYASRDVNIAQEYFAAISGGDAALQNFVERYSDPAPDEVRCFESQPARELVTNLEREERDFGKTGRDAKS